ncbi:hypothetical protein DMW05_23820 [Vibrio parahaemolyticus]|nr:hypothetical protein [Vibrio parahaemolyticus]EGR2933668.1 hypothetical protein [Vibrio parahaemolyticus]EGR2958219.1 hypothetical protein [Vibrio parahaemolyticus]EGR2963071.1 hypothetical protein [Vibrio parahaemolyticus]EGR2968007.1 hypothetical protein [Vibrio parahaemolyticus]
MQITELLELTYWIDKNLKSNNVLQAYQQLTNVVQQNVNARNNQPRQPFATQQEALIKAIKPISTNSLTHAQEDMLKKLNLYRHIGLWGVTKLEDILFRNNLDIANAHSELSKIVQELSNGIGRSDQIQTQLKPLISAGVEDETSAEDVMIRVHFQNDVAFENVCDFKKWGTVWWEIGRGIAIAHDSSPEAVKVVGAQKGSIIIELATVAAIATTASTIILSALKVAERVLAIRKQVEEIKNLKLSNKKLEVELEKEADQEKKKGLEAINEEITINLNLTADGDGEKIKVLSKAVKNLVDFVEKGGEVDFVASENAENAEELEQLKVNFSEIKRLEKKLLALENKNS